MAAMKISNSKSDLQGHSMVQFNKPNDLLILYIINIKSCSLSIVITVTDQKPQKALNITHYHIASMSNDIFTILSLISKSLKRSCDPEHIAFGRSLSCLCQYTHTHSFNGPLAGSTRVSWATCKSAPRSRQITTPAPHHSDFYRPDALPAAQPTASKNCASTIEYINLTYLHSLQTQPAMGTDLKRCKCGQFPSLV